MAGLPAGRHFARGDDGYEDARRATVWNQRVPDRYPAMIVQARDDDDVVAALAHAKANDLQVGIRSGGHSWAANHLRDGGLLLDMSGFDQATIDKDKMRAVAGPARGAASSRPNSTPRTCSSPPATARACASAAICSRAVTGGTAASMGRRAKACVGLDVITADGEKLYIDAENHPDLYFAARGAGPGFFAVVTAFHLKLYAKPAVCGMSMYAYPFDCADEVFTWAREISADVDRRVELQIVATKSVPDIGIDGPAIVLASPVFADDEKEAEEALALLGTCPAVDRALAKVAYAPTDLPTWYTAVMGNYLEDHRYSADNMWTSASAEDLMPGIHRILETMPPHPAHFLWLNWGPSPARQDMAYSVEAEIYLALYGGWMDEADDEKYADWPRANMADMAHLATGIQLADENLGKRPAKFATDEAMARLDKARAAYDPDGRFYAWMGRV